MIEPQARARAIDYECQNAADGLSVLADREKLIVPYIDGQRSIEEIALQTHNAEFNVSKLVCDGLRSGTMRRARVLLHESTPTR